MTTGALDSQPHVIKFTSCLPMVGGSPRLPPPLKLVVMILLKVALKHKQSINQFSFSLENYANSSGVDHDVPKTVVM
jgi:hypothetical protein